MKVKVVCNYDSDQNIYRIVNDIWGGYHEDLEFTPHDDYDYLVIFNRYSPNRIKVPKERVIGFVQEPSWSTFFDPQLPSYCGRVFYHKPEVFIGYDNVYKSNSIMIHHLWNKPLKGQVQFQQNNTKQILSMSFEKTKPLSIIISNRPGESRYEYRQKIVEKLLASDLDFDMYGLGWNIKDNRYKGYLYNKIKGLSKYRFSICIENSREESYISEKFFDAVLCGTVPIYHGAPDIENYYPGVSTKLEGNIVEHLKEIIKSPISYDLELGKKLYTEKYNPLSFIHDLG
jgi:hypothetical protein